MQWIVAACVAAAWIAYEVGRILGYRKAMNKATEKLESLRRDIAKSRTISF
jgi:membrane protein DedA with SNARE-associated domain